MTELRLALPVDLPAYDGVLLRGFDERDVDMVMNLATDPYLPQIGSLPGNADADQAREYIARQWSRLSQGAGYSFCVADARTGTALGTAGLWLVGGLDTGRAHVGYSVAPRSRGQGVAGRALTALVGFAWTIPELHRLEAYIEPWNIGSIGTAEIGGFQREGLLRSHQPIGGRRVDMVLYAKLRPEPS
ncbi:GNAT family N-acetyltransferase [Microlunatus speluncae]|uniref:GNAT family N-acetyltransferase n=1 Tax=Microlunatus speluncae TaxID=2594267 RepID=UPI001FE607B3|nr:GNAT family protein [Microlunatus speluncae]